MCKDVDFAITASELPTWENERQSTQSTHTFRQTLLVFCEDYHVLSSALLTFVVVGVAQEVNHLALLRTRHVKL